jgi:hypothetical protein
MFRTLSYLKGFIELSDSWSLVIHFKVNPFTVLEDRNLEHYYQIWIRLLNVPHNYNNLHP